MDIEHWTAKDVKRKAVAKNMISEDISYAEGRKGKKRERKGAKRELNGW